MTLVIIIVNGLKSEIKKTFYNPAQNSVQMEVPNGMNGEMDRMEKWFCEAQSEGGATTFDDGIPSSKFPNQNQTLYVSGIPNERSTVFVKNFLRDNIPHAADIRIPMDRVSRTIKGLAYVQLSPGVNAKDVLKQVKGLKMGSRRLQIKESNGGGFGGGSFGDDNYRPSAPLNSPIRMQSPVMFEK